MGRPKKYKIDDDYFKEINTEEKAYILGFMYADSSISNGFDINIQKRDVEILNFIKKELKMEHPIKDNIIKNREYCRLSISNKKIKNDLHSIGIPNNKNNNIVMPKIKKEFYNSFLLGFFDGDGYINDENCSMEFSGGENILTEIKNYIKNNLNVDMYFGYRYEKENKNSCKLGLHGSLKLKIIYDFLYNNRNLGLKRKKEKFKMVINKANSYNNKNFKINGNYEKIKKLYLLKYKNREISNMLNVNYNGVRSCINRIKKEIY